jgi:rod shape-determining protein MreD
MLSLVPLFTAILCGFIALGMAALLGVPEWQPLFIVAAFFFWELTTPFSLTALGCFLLGLLQDILAGSTLGSSAIILLLASVILQRHSMIFWRQPFLVHWCGLIALLLFFQATQWLLQGGLLGSVDAIALLMQTGLTILLFPAVYRVLLAAAVRLPEPKG